MRHRHRLTILLCAVLLSVSHAQTTTLVEALFQDTSPFLQTNWDTTTSSLNEFTDGGPGACNGVNWWNFSHVTSGGWNNRAYVRWLWCDFDTAGPGGFTSGQAGWFDGGGFTPSGGWQTSRTYSTRVRLYFESGLIRYVTGGSENDHHFKFLLLAPGTSSERPIMFVMPGNYDPFDEGAGTAFGGSCDGNVTTQICISFQRNINHFTQAAYALVPVGEWVHIQLLHRTGADGVAFVKIYVNNNVEGSPTSQDTDFDGTAWGTPNYAGGFNVGQAANQGTATDGDFAVRIMDFIFGDGGFYPTWFPGALPGALLRLREH